MSGPHLSNYTDRITRILPTEFVATYLTVTQIVRDDLTLRQPLLLLCLVACLILIPIFLNRIKKNNDRRHHVIVMLSFLIWAYALGDAFEPGSLIPFDLYRTSLGAALLVVWGLVPLALDVDRETEV